MDEQPSIGLFAGIPKSDVALIEGLARTCEFSPAQNIARSSERAGRLFLIIAGQVDYFVDTPSGREVLLRRLTTGDVFGFGALFSHPTGYLGTAVASGSTKVFAWDHKLVRQIAQKHPRFIEYALRIAFQYFESELERHTSLISQTAQERLAMALMTLGSRVGRLLGGAVEVSISNEKLASQADVSRFTASRTLKGWERKGAVKKSYGKVLITSPEKLLPLAK